MRDLKIGELADRTGTSAPTVRYYEQIALKALERSPIAFVESCDASCAGGPGPDCVFLDDLAKSPAAERHHLRRGSLRS